MSIFTDEKTNGYQWLSFLHQNYISYLAIRTTHKNNKQEIKLD